MGSEGAGGPDPLVTLLANRVSALPETTRAALALAGIATEPDLDLLSDAYGSGLRRALQPAIRAELVRIEAGRVRFSHPLIAAAAEASVSRSTRRELHLMLAAATSAPEVRATHLAQATDLPDPDVAASIERAGRVSSLRGARAAGAELFEAAARLTPPDDEGEVARRQLVAAEHWYAAGDSRRARNLLTALWHAPSSGDHRGEAGWRLGVILDEVGDWKAATAIWREALVDTVDPGLRSRVLCSLAITAFYTESVETALAQAASAVAAAEVSPDPAHLARALAVQALTMAVSGTTGQTEVVDRAMALEAGIDEFLGEWSPSGAAAECARHAGDVDRARRHYATVIDRAVEAGDANVEQWASFGLAQTELLAGNYRRAADLADAVLDIADQTGQMGIAAGPLRAQIDAQLGDLERARAEVDEAIRRASVAAETTHLFSSHVALGLIEAYAGDLASAARTYREARRLAAGIGLAHATALRACLAEVEAAAAAGELEQAEEAFAAFEVAVGGNAPRWSASVACLARASLLVAHGDLPGGARGLEQAPDDEAVLPLDRGRVLFMLGSIRRRMREFARARDTLTRALAIFAALEARPWIDRTERELQRIPGRRAGQPDMLTAAETRIAELVAAGRSNREVAAALFVSVKTVELTLTRVYQKLGVHSRTELAHRFGAAARH
jgi:DNA-binding CsgD family transcriptional regulator